MVHRSHTGDVVQCFMCNRNYAQMYDVKMLVYCIAQKILVKCSVVHRLDVHTGKVVGH